MIKVRPGKLTFPHVRTTRLARYLAEVDYVDHFAWVAVDSAAVPVGGVTYVRSVSDRALADISFLIED